MLERHAERREGEGDAMKLYDTNSEAARVRRALNLPHDASADAVVRCIEEARQSAVTDPHEAADETLAQSVFWLRHFYDELQGDVSAAQRLAADLVSDSVCETVKRVMVELDALRHERGEADKRIREARRLGREEGREDRRNDPERDTLARVRLAFGLDPDDDRSLGRAARALGDALGAYGGVYNGPGTSLIALAVERIASARVSSCA